MCAMIYLETLPEGNMQVQEEMTHRHQFKISRMVPLRLRIDQAGRQARAISRDLSSSLILRTSSMLPVLFGMHVQQGARQDAVGV